MPYISDEMLKKLVFGLMVDEYPGYGVMSEVVWDSYGNIMEQLTDSQVDDVLDRLSDLIRSAEITITWPEGVS